MVFSTKGGSSASRFHSTICRKNHRTEDLTPSQWGDGGANLSQPNPRTAAILWFVAAALVLLAALIHYMSGELRWSYLAAGVFLTIMGFTKLRHSRSGQS